MRRRELLRTVTAGLAAGAVGTPHATRAADGMVGRTFLVAHGAWSAGWSWKKMHPLLAAAGHRLFTPSYTGLGERAHLASTSNDLETHIQDLLGVIKFEDLRDIVLIGHSYGGMVATGVADRATDRIARLVYLDAFVPKDGQSQADLLLDGRRTFELRAKAGDGWRVPPNPSPPDTSEADLAWIAERRMPQSLKCFLSPLKLVRGETRLPRTYIYCKRAAPGDPFRPFAERARAEGWPLHELEASHSPQVTAPEALATLLLDIANHK